MIRLTRFQITLVLLALLFLRLTIGYHFFKEGVAKITSGSFSAEGFLSSARGPLAPYYQKLIEDGDNAYLLCYDREEQKVDPELTLFIWEDYKNRVANAYHFGDPNQVETLKRQRSADFDKIEKLRATIKEAERLPEDQADDSAPRSNVDAEKAELAKLIARYEQAEQDIKAIRGQPKKANEVFEQYSAALNSYLDENREDIENYFRGLNRLDGFEQDGKNRELVANQVPTLFGQVTKIKSTMEGDAAPWISTLHSTWDNFEQDINNLILEEDRGKIDVALFRTHDRGPILKFIDAVVPYFDLSVGILLFIGLFTRMTSVLAAGFLAAIISTQLPWVAGAAPTYYQFVEFAGLLVLAATCAGRIGGLDYFLNSLFSKWFPSKTENAE